MSRWYDKFGILGLSPNEVEGQSMMLSSTCFNNSCHCSLFNNTQLFCTEDTRAVTVRQFPYKELSSVFLKGHR